MGVTENMEQKQLYVSAHIPDLLRVQIEPYKKFLQKDIQPAKRERTGLEEIMSKVFPEIEILPGEKSSCNSQQMMEHCFWNT